MPARRLAAGVAAAVIVVVGTMVSAVQVLLLIAAGGVVAIILGLVRADAGRRHRAEARADTAELAHLLACHLSAGLLPQNALASTATDHAVLAPAAICAASGGDVSGALAAAASLPGREGLSEVAGAWRVAERVGAPFADVLTRVATSVSETVELQREVDAEVTPARATARVMAVLPLFGLLLGAGLGADPLGVVVESVLGASCVCAGVGLAALGLFWIDRIVTRAES